MQWVIRRVGSCLFWKGVLERMVNCRFWHASSTGPVLGKGDLSVHPVECSVALVPLSLLRAVEKAHAHVRGWTGVCSGHGPCGGRMPWLLQRASGRLAH